MVIVWSEGLLHISSDIAVREDSRPGKYYVPQWKISANFIIQR